MQLSIPITKAGNRKITIDTDEVFNRDEGVTYMAIFAEGMKVFLNKNMSKITVKDLEGEALEEAREAAFQKGLENLEKLMKEGVKKRGSTDASGAKVPAIIMTEAKRLAKEVLKDNYRNKTGRSPSQVSAKSWTEAAAKLVESDPSYIETAKANIEARKTKVAAKPEVNVENAEELARLKAQQEAAAEEFAALGIRPDAKLVKKAEEEKAARKKDRQLSAAQAGKVAPRKRPEARVH